MYNNYTISSPPYSVIGNIQNQLSIITDLLTITVSSIFVYSVPTIPARYFHWEGKTACKMACGSVRVSSSESGLKLNPTNWAHVISPSVIYKCHEVQGIVPSLLRVILLDYRFQTLICLPKTYSGQFIFLLCRTTVTVQQRTNQIS